jgi:uncharacterized protein (DUF58 family)
MVAADVAVRARLASTGADVLPALVDALAPLEPSLVETDPQLLAGEVIRQVAQRSLVVLFGSLDTGTESGLLPAATALVARHELIVAAVADPALDAMTADVDSVEGAYAAAAAELAIAERADVVRRLHRLGVHVVEGAPGVFASRVTDAYLDLKAAGRL